MSEESDSSKSPLMNRERWAGVIFLGAALILIGLVAAILASSSSRYLRYTVIFDSGKDLKVGDRVQLNGVDIGEVQRVDLIRNGSAVQVRLKIDSEHKTKVSSKSTAYIANSTTLNVSGQKVVQIYNSASPAPPMRPNAVIEGKDTLLELNAWRLKEKANEWGDSLTEAGRELREGAKNLTDGAREALSGARQGVSKSIREGIGGALKGGDDADAPPPDSAQVERQARRGKPKPPPKLDPPAEPTIGPAGVPGDEGAGSEGEVGAESEESRKTTAEARDLIARLTQFLADLGSRGKTDLENLINRWDELQREAGALIVKLKTMGREFLGERLKKLTDQIREQMEHLRQGDEETVPPVELTPEPAKNKPIPI